MEENRMENAGNEYKGYEEYVGRHSGMSREGGIGEVEYRGVIGEVWGEIGRRMMEGEEYDLGGIRIRYEEAVRVGNIREEGGKKVGNVPEIEGVKVGMRIIRGNMERKGREMNKIKYMIKGEERKRIERYEGRKRLYREGAGW